MMVAEVAYYSAIKENHHGRCVHCNQVPFSDLTEVCCVGARIGGRFENTAELHIMKYDEAMATKDVKEWHDAVGDEHNCMLKHEVFEVVDIKNVPDDATILTSTWAMKKKANGTFHARLNTRGFEQIDGEHYDSACR
jgi:hypothetical protein